MMRCAPRGEWVGDNPPWESGTPVPRARRYATGSISVGSAGSAHSLVASLGFIVASGGAIVAGTKAPGIVLLAFVPMFFIALAYQQLNRAEPDCGTTFTWATRALSRAPPDAPRG